MDEPTSGLDPLMEAVFKQCIREVTGEGRTVLLSSHILGQVEALCDRVTIIRAGRAVESGTLKELRHLTRTTVRAETERPVSGLDGLDGVHSPAVADGEVSFDVDAEHLDGAIRHVTGFGLRGLLSHPPSLEQLFLRHYEQGAEQPEGGGAGR